MNNKLKITIFVLLFLTILIISLYFIITHFTKKSKQSLLKNLKIPSKDDIMFDYKKKCYSQNVLSGTGEGRGGILSFGKNSGLLKCFRRDKYGSDVVSLYPNEMDLVTKIYKNYTPSSERDRLNIYFSIVYPNTPSSYWKNMSDKQIENYYKNLELFYELPDNIKPKTDRSISRKTPFYRGDESKVILDQERLRPAVATDYVEVMRYGDSTAIYKDPTLFNGNFYYPAKGSGIFLPIGKSLIAYNKGHALLLLGRTPLELYCAARNNQGNSQNLKNLCENMPLNNLPDLDPDKDFFSILVQDEASKQCGIKFDTRSDAEDSQCFISALNTVFDNFSKGKSLIKKEKVKDDGTKYDYYDYYGIGDIFDTLMAQAARDLGYDTIQLIREPQENITTTLSDNTVVNVVGSELLHLYEPIASQEYLTRLDISQRPYNNTINSFLQPKFNIDFNIKGVNTKYISKTPINPFSNMVSVNDYRNKLIQEEIKDLSI